MPTRNLQGYGGIAPRIDKRALAETMAQQAHNVRLRSGALEALHQPDTIGALTSLFPVSGNDTQSVYKWRYNNTSKWLGYDSDVDFGESPLALDAKNRLYRTEGGKLYVHLWDDPDEVDYQVRVPTATEPTVANTSTSPVLDEVDGWTLKEEFKLLQVDGGVYTDASGWRSPTPSSQNAVLLERKFVSETRIECVYRFPMTLTGQVATDSADPPNAITFCKLPLTLTENGTDHPATAKAITGHLNFEALAFNVTDVGRFRLADQRARSPDCRLVQDGNNFAYEIDEHEVTLIFELDYSNQSYLGDGGPVSYVVALVDQYGNESVVCDPVEVTKEVGYNVDITLIDPDWASGTTYDEDDEVVYSSKIYKSLQDNNSNKQPDAETAWWEEVSTIPSGTHIEYFRIYRTTAGDSGGTFRFVADVAATETSYTDSVSSLMLGEQLVTVENPPTSMSGLISLPNGFFAAFNGRDIFFCEPYKPYNWPTKYRLTVDYGVVGLATAGNDLYVMTEGHPYVAVGSAPERMTLAKIQINQSCVSKASIVQVGGQVIYASPDGLVSLVGGGGQLVTEAYWSKREWDDLVPSTIVASVHDGELQMTANGTAYSIIFAADGLTISTNDVPGDYYYFDLLDDTLYLITGTNLKSFATSDLVFVATWHSKAFQDQKPMIYTCARVISDNYPVYLDCYDIRAGGWRAVRVESEEPVRLPSIGWQREHEYRLRTSNDVLYCTISSSMDEL